MTQLVTIEQLRNEIVQGHFDIKEDVLLVIDDDNEIDNLLSAITVMFWGHTYEHIIRIIHKDQDIGFIYKKDRDALIRAHDFSARSMLDYGSSTGFDLPGIYSNIKEGYKCPCPNCQRRYVIVGGTRHLM